MHSAEQVAALTASLRTYLLRRTKEEVEKRLPPKLETTISCPLSEYQLFWYKRLLLRESALLKELEAAHEENLHERMLAVADDLCARYGVEAQGAIEMSCGGHGCSGLHGSNHG